MPAFWLLGDLVLTFLVLLDCARKGQLTVRIIEEPVFFATVAVSPTGEIVVVPRTRIIFGGKLGWTKSEMPSDSRSKESHW
jgi:hypothetical protein